MGTDPRTTGNEDRGGIVTIIASCGCTLLETEGTGYPVEYASTSEEGGPAIVYAGFCRKCASALLLEPHFLSVHSPFYYDHPFNDQSDRSLAERQPNSTRHDVGSNPTGRAITEASPETDGAP